MAWICEFCNALWTRKEVPTTWHESRVVALFKKGDLGDRANYRPISLLCVGYKLYASILLQRLKSGSAEKRIWPTQYGFRSGCGTADALVLARRMLGHTAQLANGKLLMIALDWAKAFDSITPDRMRTAMRRFGIPEAFVRAVAGIYTDQKFFVRDAGNESTWHDQHFGIVQGCPLSPFLFSIAMTCLLHDADELVQRRHGPPTAPGLVTRSLMYADDTLLVEVGENIAQYYMDCIRQLGAE